MQVFDYRLIKPYVNTINNVINTFKMVDSFNYIINRDSIFRYANCICLEDITRLFVSESASFNMIRVICQFDLRLMINAAFNLIFFLKKKSMHQRRFLHRMFTFLW